MLLTGCCYDAWRKRRLKIAFLSQESGTESSTELLCAKKKSPFMGPSPPTSTKLQIPEYWMRHWRKVLLRAPCKFNTVLQITPVHPVWLLHIQEYWREHWQKVLVAKGNLQVQHSHATNPSHPLWLLFQTVLPILLGVAALKLVHVSLTNGDSQECPNSIYQ